MSIALVVRSYLVDFPWLEWSVRSMRQYLHGVDERVLITPCGHVPSEEILSYFDKHIQTLELVDGYVAQQIDKLLAWQHTDCGYLLYSDSDCIYKERWSPRSRIDELGRCLLYRSPWYELPTYAHMWRDVAEKHTGYRPEFEYMRSQPLLHHSAVMQEMLAGLPDLISNAQKLKHKDFSEFNILGAWIEQHAADRYVFNQQWPHWPCKQYWSHTGLTQEVLDEIKAML